jgi:hypothetical protein
MFLFSGCNDDDNPNSPTTPVGTWKGSAGTTSTMTAELKSDKTFIMHISTPYNGTPTDYELEGTWVNEGDKVTFTGKSGFSVIGIPPPSVNPFIGTVSGNKMTLNVPYNETVSIVLTKE